MEAIFTEKMIREELKRLDLITGLHGADLPIKFGKAKCTLGKFSYASKDGMFFYFSNYFFEDPNLPVEEKLDTIRHEYAHYYDYMLHGSSSHGVLWKMCCNKVGAVPVRCFSKERSDLYMLKHKKERMLNEKYDSYSIGTEIFHPIFGRGKIIEITGESFSRIATVYFCDVGEKEITVSWIASNCKRT